jgi:hypothetical protein
VKHYEEQWSRPRSFCHARPPYSGPGSYTSFDFWGEWLVMLWQGTPPHLNQPYVESLRQAAPYAGVWLVLCFALWVWKRNQTARAVAEAPNSPVGAAVGAREIDQLSAELRAQVVQSVPGSAFHESSVQPFVSVMIDADAHCCCRQWQRESRAKLMHR